MGRRAPVRRFRALCAMSKCVLIILLSFFLSFFFLLFCFLLQISAFAPNPLLSELLNEHDTDGIDRDVFYCSSHSGQSLRFYCNDCDSAICSSCSDIEHGDHRTVRLENAAMEHHQVLHQIVQLSKAQVWSVRARNL